MIMNFPFVSFRKEATVCVTSLCSAIRISNANLTDHGPCIM